MLGTVYRVLTQNADLAGQIDDLLSGFTVTTKPARAAHIIQITGKPGEAHKLHMGCYRRAGRDQAEELLAPFMAVLNQSVIGEVSKFAAHAAVLEIEDEIVALPAESGAGKTTLAAASVMAGFDYLSDEALVLDDEGRVIPYPKPMALSPWSCERLGLEPGGEERLVTAEELGGSKGAGGASLSALVVTRFGAGQTTMERLPSSRAVSELIAKSFNHYKDPARAFRLATQTARVVRVWQLDYDDPHEAARLLASRLGAT